MKETLEFWTQRLIVALGCLTLTACHTPLAPKSPPRTDTVTIEKTLIENTTEKVVVEFKILPGRKSWVSFGKDIKSTPGVTWFEGSAPMTLRLTAQRSESIRGHAMAAVKYEQGYYSGQGLRASRQGSYEFLADGKKDIAKNVSLIELPDTLDQNRLYLLGHAFGEPLYFSCSDSELALASAE